MSKTMKSLLLLVCLTGLLHAQNLPVDPDLRMGKLKNGLTYYIKKNIKPEKRAELRIAMNYGAVQEDDDQNGLAHFTEHMCFNGTKNFPKNGMIDFINSIGMDFGSGMNAFTSYDQIVYNLVVPTDNADAYSKGIQVLRDWAQDVSFEDEEIDKERGVIIEEWRGGRGAEERMRRKHLQTVFTGSKYAERNVIGKKEILESFKYATIKKFYHDWFRPDLQAITIVGDIDVDATEKMIQKQFADLKMPADVRKKEDFLLKKHQETLYSIAADKEASRTSTELYIKLPVKEMKSIADYRAGLAGSMGREMLNSRYSELSKSANPPFIYAYNYKYRIIRPSDFFICGAGTKEDGIISGLTALLTEVERAARFGFTASELERIKSALKRQNEVQLAEKDKTESDDIVWNYIGNFLWNAPLMSGEQEAKLALSIIDQISLDEVNNEFKSYLTKENRVLTVSMPEKEGLKIVTEDEIKAVVEAVSKADLKQYEDKVVTEPLIKVLPAAGKIVAEKENALAGVKEFTLSNGARIIYKKTDFKNDEVLFKAYSKGGSSKVKDSDVISAMLASNLIVESGLGGFDNSALDKYLSGSVVKIEPYINEEEEGLAGEFSPKDGKVFCELLYSYFTNLRKDQQSFNSFYANLDAMIKNNGLRPEAVFKDSIVAIMNNYHPRAKTLNSETVKELNFDQAFEIFKSRFAGAADFVFVFVGNLTENDLKSLCETYIASLPAGNTSESFTDLNISPKKGQVKKKVFKGQEDKSVLNLTVSSDFEFKKENLVAVYALNDVINEKLRENIREKMSGVYYVYAYPQFRKYPRESIVFNFGLGCSPDRVEELTGAIKIILDSLQTINVSDKYIAQTKESTIRARETNLKTNRYWLNNLYFYDHNQLDLKDFINHEEYNAKISADLIRETAKKYLDYKTNLIDVALYPESMNKK